MQQLAPGMDESMMLLLAKHERLFANRLVERSFEHCVTSFRGKTLDGAEKDCIDKYVAKFQRHSSMSIL